MGNKIVAFIKKETVLSVAGILAVCSMFFVHPSWDYLSYIDFRVLALLWCLMLVVAGFQKIGFFNDVINVLLRWIHTTRTLTFILVYLCFFSSMLITNDVSLITFVPFAVLLFQKIGKEKQLAYVVVLQTIAANLGSMFTPIGNPQNLYLYSTFGISIGEFFGIMLPTVVTSFVLLGLCILLVKSEEISVGENLVRTEEISVDGNLVKSETLEEGLTGSEKRRSLIFLLALFALCIACVLHVLDYRILLLVLLVAMWIFDRSLIGRADYMLLLTFVAFFLFIGNMKNIPAFSTRIEAILENREILVTLLASQIVSNVPATVLLSGFTTDYRGLMLGANIGGLGTLIASMASLISYKAYTGIYKKERGTYLLLFTGMNVLFLMGLLAVTYLPFTQ